ncbi:uncharacterized protein I303_105231 [Kwoniella dejecticola CBS 10117]|uniref:Aminoglycoside phosphotransferase domain-containing protein n=1 Tax=Kwoniella dejecticola CBS 10117 TaxID=1296121 RepID=A0A1A6A327_9TREE|nr:uncharacterized protein I303_05322 [Kwoniella dejecticola CBS 10117]OBR84464.1 hypothetical protein I303_05322 [Kwoniella dejecticola CBS 10117]
MPMSLQPYVELTTDRRRFFETFSPSIGCRLFIKRSATLEEATKNLNRAGTPAELVENSFASLQNEASAIAWIGKNTSVPVPRIFAAYEDRGCFYLIQEYQEDCIPAIQAPKELHPYITQHIAAYLQQLHSYRSLRAHSFTDRLFLPARMGANKTYFQHLPYPEDQRRRCVLCHGDLGWQNVMVHPETGEIKVIIDWEFAGFWPVEIEGDYWRRFGTASAFGDDVNDVDSITQLLFNLTNTGQFDETYKSPHLEDNERLPLLEGLESFQHAHVASAIDNEAPTTILNKQAPEATDVSLRSEAETMEQQAHLTTDANDQNNVKASKPDLRSTAVEQTLTTTKKKRKLSSLIKRFLPSSKS